MSTVLVLRRVRDDLVGNPEIKETRKAGTRAKVARARALEMIESTRSEKADRSVWVPPSKSSSSGRPVANSTKRSVEDLESKLRSAKTNARLHAGEVRRLSLKRAFLVWRAMSAVRGEMERALAIIEGDDEVEAAERALAAWRDVAEPWVYDESVLESAELFRLVSVLGRQDRTLQYWRQLVLRRNDLEARREVFEEHVAGRVLQDALLHWKVYRLAHHLECGREDLASQFDRVRRLKAVFVHLRDRARRRVLVRSRMEAAALPGPGTQLTVDDLLSIGEPKIGRFRILVEPYVVLDECLLAVMDVQGRRALLQNLKAASMEMGRIVRWRGLEGVAWFDRAEQGLEELPDGSQVSEISGISEAVGGDGVDDSVDDAEDEKEINTALAACRERIETVLGDQHAVLAEMSKISGSKLPRLQRKQDAALKNLSACEKVLSDMEAVSQKIERQLRSASDSLVQREADHADAVAVVDHLERVHAATAEALDAATSRMASHAEERSNIDEKIDQWQSKIRDHAREVELGASGTARMTGRAGRPTNSITAAVKLEEARDRLRRAEARKVDMDASYDSLVAAREDAAAVERRARDELARGRLIADKAEAAATAALERANGLREQHAQLETDYEGLVPCLEKLLAAVDASEAATAAAFERAAELDAQHDALETTLAELQDDLQRLEEEKSARLAAEEALAQDQVVPDHRDHGVGVGNHGDGNHDSSHPPLSPLKSTSTTTLWGNESFGFHLLCRRRGTPMIPGDRLMLRSADSYHVLVRARSCLFQWRFITRRMLASRQEAERRFVAHVAPATLIAWREQTRERRAAREAWNDGRVLASAFSVWKRVSHEMHRHGLLVASCRAVSASRTVEQVLAAWKDVTEEERACRDAAHRRDLVVRSDMFAFWRAKTARSADLAARLAPICARKDVELARAAYNEWFQATRNRLALRSAFGSACDLWSQRVQADAYFDESNAATVLADCINAWSLVVHRAREDRRLAAIHGAIETKHDQIVCRSYFRELRATAHVQKREREAASRAAEAARDAAALRRCFSHLRDWAAHRAITSAKLQVKWTYDHPLRAAIGAWAQALERRRAMDGRAIVCHKLRRVLVGEAIDPSETSVTSEMLAASEIVSQTNEPIKSATYHLATDPHAGVSGLSELSFCCSLAAADEVSTADGNEATAISL